MSPRSWSGIGLFLVCALSLFFSHASALYVLETEWGSAGAGPGQFASPRGIASDGAGLVYVTDTYNNRTQVFDSANNYLFDWGVPGIGNGQFVWPYGIARNTSAGNFYIVDQGNHRVQVFDSGGNYLSKWGSMGGGGGTFLFPRGIAVNSSGYVYVADTGNDVVQLFVPSGGYLFQFTPGALGGPQGLALNSTGYLYSTSSLVPFVARSTAEGIPLSTFGGAGAADGLFGGPANGIAVNSSDYVFVCDPGNNRVQVFDPSGNFVTKWSVAGPIGIMVDSADRVFVTEVDRVQIYAIIVPIAQFSGIPTSGSAPLPVSFTDSSLGSPTAWSWSFGDGTFSILQNPPHTYNSAGTYTVSLTASNANGANTTTLVNYIIVTSGGGPPPPPPPGPPDAGISGGGDAAPAPAPAPPQPEQKLEQKQEPPPQPPVPPEETSSAPPGQVSERYPIGFEGLAFNADDGNTLTLDLDAAQRNDALVTQFFDRVEVYQHGSPGVTITFYGNNFTIRDRKITGKVDRAEFRTDPLAGNISAGNISASVRVDLLALTQRVSVQKTLDANVTADARATFHSAAATDMLSLQDIAFTLDVQKFNLTRTGSANVTLLVPEAWVVQHGGNDAIRIGRIPADGGAGELLRTRYLGTVPGGALKFDAYSPRGTSVFGMLAIKASETKATPLPSGATPAPQQKTSVTTITGIFGWVTTLLEEHLLIAIPVVLIIIGFVIYAWRERRPY